MRFLTSLSNFFPETVSEAIRNRFARGPIDTVEEIIDFVQTRSAYVCQTSLFGYLKERMGTSYPKFFEDETFSASINLAKLRLYKACSSDLTIFAVATIMRDSGLEHTEAVELAEHCFSRTLDYPDSLNTEEKTVAIADFRGRASTTHWADAAVGENAFTVSPSELVAAAPVIDDFKRSDTEIVINSIRFRWRDIREQYRKRVQPIAVARDFKPDNMDAGK